MVMRLIFMGTPDFSVPILDALQAAGHEIAAVYSQPARPAGRGMADIKSAVHRRAVAMDLTVRTPVNFKDAATRVEFQSFNADAAVVAAYGLILPQEILSSPRLGCFNVHASLLPRWRGAAPIQRAIMAGDTVSGVTIMKMERGLDTGPMCLVREIAITAGMTAGELHDQLSAMGAELMGEALRRLEDATLIETPQPSDGVTYAAKIEKRETRLMFGVNAVEVVNRIRGLSPFPGAWFEVAAAGGTERIKVLAADVIGDGDEPTVAGDRSPGVILDATPTIGCAAGAVRLRTVQRAGKKPVTAAEFMRGFRLPIGTRVG